MSDFHPLVSIIIPVYNGENFLQSAIDSALGQDYDHLEVIVVNDGSKDNTEKIAKSYGNKIKYFYKENGGVATALNMAVENAEGEYISWLSHDDYYMPEKVTAQVDALKKVPEGERAKLVAICDRRIIDVPSGICYDTIYTASIPWMAVLAPSTFFDGMTILYRGNCGGCALLIPKKLFDDCGMFDSKFYAVQDYDMWFRMLKAGYRFFYVPGILQVTRNHKDQDSIAKRKQMMKETEYLYNDKLEALFEEELKILKKDHRFRVSYALRKKSIQDWRNIK
jgi:glycosyltransferase involved in cell wall biosynthesis